MPDAAADDTASNDDGWHKITRKTNNSSVDTSRPFNSVKEAVAIFGERILAPGIYHSTLPTTTSPSSWKSASPFSNHSSSTPTNNINIVPHNQVHDLHDLHDEQGGSNDESVIMESVKRLEAELEETKAELKQLKERGCETEIALASLNAELHKNMSKLALAEAEAARKAADDKVKMAEVNSPTLAQILNLGAELESGGYYSNFGWSNNNNKAAAAAESNGWNKTKKKKKPIVPLVGDLFWKKKNDGKSDHNNPLYASPNIF
ncbi:WEB family protein At1g75720 [Linum grandiflorum]